MESETLVQQGTNRNARRGSPYHPRGLFRGALNAHAAMTFHYFTEYIRNSIWSWAI
ncbi:hypothetical protein AAC691_13350 [Nguyenibacter vanlangensis]|uniref:Uncharacterized protein n=1 Tax=Nguyenibacter vanlangensis TaxID=1216886 RepID=A0ABZ3D134_9PROT